jgi:MFS family permease
MESRRRESEREHEHEERLRPVGRERFGYEARAVGFHGLVDWSSVWVGLIVGFAAFSILGALVSAIGLTTGGGTGAYIWGLVVLFFGFLIGSYVAGLFSSIVGRREGWVLGSLIWALGTAITMVLATIGLGGLFTAIVGGATGVTTSPQQVAVGTLIALIVAYIGSVIGAITGCSSQRGIENR